jgi:hypothetical protein
MILETHELALWFQVFECLGKNTDSTKAKSEVFDAAARLWVCDDRGICGVKTVSRNEN